MSLTNEIRDPSLYRLFVFLGWTPREKPENSSRRLQRIEKVLRKLAWIPETARVPDRHQLAWAQRTLWDAWNGIDQWNIHRFCQSHHEELVVLLGVEQDGLAPEQDGWIDAAVKRWNLSYGAEDEWHAVVARYTDIDHKDRPRVIGEGWLWTAEWDEPPNSGWETFGRHRYGENSYVPFPWGLLGYCDSDARVRFDVHTTTALKKRRDEFLFSTLPLVTLEYLKANQFLRYRYEHSVGPDLDNLESRILQASVIGAKQFRGLALRVAEKRVADLTDLVYKFSSTVADLEEDARGVEIAMDNVRQLLGESGVSSNSIGRSAFVFPIKRLQEQVRSDLAYYGVTVDRGRQALEACRTLIEIERTRAENRLVVMGTLIGSFLALGHVLHELPLVPRLVISLGAGVATALAYWIWSKTRWN